jgi:hypothetical protein
MVCPPDQVYTDPDVVAYTRETLRRHGAAPPLAQPTHEQFLTALTQQLLQASSPVRPQTCSRTGMTPPSQRQV